MASSPHAWGRAPDRRCVDQGLQRGHWLPSSLGLRRDLLAPQGHGGAARIEEERSLPPSQKVSRDGMYCYFVINNVIFYYCYLSFILFLFIIIIIIIIFFLNFPLFLLNRLFRARLGWKKFTIPLLNSWRKREEEGSRRCRRCRLSRRATLNLRRR